MKKWALLLILVLCASVMGGCGSNEESFPEADASVQTNPMTVTAAPTTAPAASSWEDYDPASEEDSADYSFNPGASYDDYGNQRYAGASPIPLDPIDMPTPTPKPTLTFSYGDVDASNIGLSCQAPAGCGIEMPDNETVILTDPNAYDGVNATMTIRIYSVPSSYKLSDIRTVVSDMVKDIGQYNFQSFRKEDLAARTLLKKDGYYTDYRGVYYDGTAVNGRVMAALLDGNRVITLHLVCAHGFFDSSYKGVVKHFRDTAKLTQ